MSANWINDNLASFADDTVRVDVYLLSKPGH